MLASGGCAPSATRGGFESPDSAARLYAIHRAGKACDHTAIPQLIESLESDDPVVRMMAIQALERIEGQRLGYRPYGSPEERQSAVTAWQLTQAEAPAPGNPATTPAQPDRVAEAQTSGDGS